MIYFIVLQWKKKTFALHCILVLKVRTRHTFSQVLLQVLMFLVLAEIVHCFSGKATDVYIYLNAIMYKPFWLPFRCTDILICFVVIILLLFSCLSGTTCIAWTSDGFSIFLKVTLTKRTASLSAESWTCDLAVVAYELFNHKFTLTLVLKYFSVLWTQQTNIPFSICVAMSSI